MIAGRPLGPSGLAGEDRLPNLDMLAQDFLPDAVLQIEIAPVEEDVVAKKLAHGSHHVKNHEVVSRLVHEHVQIDVGFSFLIAIFKLMGLAHVFKAGADGIAFDVGSAQRSIAGGAGLDTQTELEIVG